MTIITPTGITGITSITSTGNTLQFQNPSGADVSVSGLNVTSGTNINVTGIVTASGGFSGNINSTGVSTFRNIVGVSTIGVTTAYVISINNGQLGGSRNMIINGSMVVNQRGFTGTAGTTIDAGFPVDRFKLSQNNSAVVSAGQTTMNPTVGGNAYNDGFSYALYFKVTTAQPSLSAGNFQIVQQNIEGYNLQGIKKGSPNAQPVTLSFWVRSNTTGTYIVDIHDNDNTRSCSQLYSINVANTWEKKVLTFPADTTGYFDNDNNLSAYLNWWLASGTTYNSGTLQTSWAAITNANRAVGQTNLLATVNNEFWLTGVQLEVGDRATEFERRSYGQELALCHRYCQTYSGRVGIGNWNGPTGAVVTTHLYAPFRTTPSIFSFTAGNCLVEAVNWYSVGTVTITESTNTVVSFALGSITNSGQSVNANAVWGNGASVVLQAEL